MAMIYDELKKDHEKLQSVLDELAVAENTETRQSLVAKVRDLLVPHSRAEEAVFYNVLRDTEEGKAVVMHGYKEHLKAETLLRGLQITEAIALKWKSGVEKLQEDLTHHIDEEEGKIFDVAKSVLSTEEAEAIGRAFVQLKPKISGGVFSSQMEYLAYLMPSRFRKSFLDNFDRASDEAARKAS